MRVVSLYRRLVYSAWVFRFREHGKHWSPHLSWTVLKELPGMRDGNTPYTGKALDLVKKIYDNIDLAI